MPNKMDSKIDVIQRLLTSRGHQLTFVENGCRLSLNVGDQVNCSIDFYVLLSAPDQVRAKLSVDQAEPISDPVWMSEVQEVLEEALRGAATVEAFSEFGVRGKSQISYAHVIMAATPETIIKRLQAAEKAFEEIQNVDSRQFRKGLDQLNLPRSSSVRVALMRIFRDSIDAQDLLVSADREADNILNADQWRVIKEIRAQNKLPATHRIIDMLWEAVSQKFIDRARHELDS